MAGYIGSKAVLLSTTAAVVTGDMTVAGATTLSGAFTSLGIDDNATATAVTVNPSGLVGVGTATPESNLHIFAGESGGAPSIGALTLEDNTHLYLQFLTPSTKEQGVLFGDVDNNVGGVTYSHVTDSMMFTANAAERMRINSSGNVGIGTVTPNVRLEVAGSSAQMYLNNTDTTANGSHDFSLTAIKPGIGYNNLNITGYETRFKIGGGATEAMRIDSSGNVLVGKTAQDFGATRGFEIYQANGDDVLFMTRSSNPAVELNRLTDTGSIMRFKQAGTVVGYISVTGSSTAYVTSSDYRLKENITPVQGASDIVKAMRPVTYTFKADSTDWHDGFLAHELQELHPRAVSGEKDAMKDEEYEVTPAVYEDILIPAVEAVAEVPAVYDDEGVLVSEMVPAVEAQPERTEQQLVSEAVMGTRSVPDYQGVDYSKLTPILTAALQEALTEIAALKVRVAALEVTP